MVNLIQENWQALLGVLGSVFAFFGGRKMKKSEEKKTESDALSTMQTTYDTFVADFRERYNEIKEELKNYREEQLQLRQEIIQLRQENNDLRKELKDWEGKYTKLKKEFETYKAEN
jgi:cell shape-determining protein MreC